MTNAEVRKAVEGFADSVAILNGVFTVRRGFFYRCGGSAEALRAAVEKAVPGACILDSGEKWTAFNGGASLARSTHWWVKFTVAPVAVAQPEGAP